MAFKSRIQDKLAFLQEARERFAFALSLDAEDRAIAKDDVSFVAALPREDGSTAQWPEEMAKARVAVFRPVLTENRLPTFTAQISNDGRQNKPAIKISAMDKGTKETAEYLQGRIRQIEYESDADTAYDTAREQQIVCGRGFLRVTTEYEPKSFKQIARIRRIEDQFSVVFGPSKEYDCSDAPYFFVVTHITKDEHKQKYGEDTTAQQVDFASEDNPAPGWLGVGKGGELIQEAEYWRKEYKKRTLCLLQNGETAWKDELPADAAILDERPCDDLALWQYIIDGADILDETQWIGTLHPVIPEWGREAYVEGKRRTFSLVRPAKDPQRLLNLYVSNIAEAIGQMPKNPYRAPVGAIAGFEELWARINTDPMAVVPYNQWDDNGRELRPPERESAEPPIQALVIGYNQAVDAIKASMGIFDASIGNRSNETSGVAIQRRQKESDNTNYHFHDNEARTRKSLGRVLLEILPLLDKGVGDRAVRSEDGKSRMVRVGEPWHDEELGKTVHHDLEAGSYGVAVSTGPSFTSQRQEAFDTYSQIANADKQFMQVAGDLLFRNLDAPGSEQIADRYEKMLPAPLQPQKSQQQPLPQQLQQMLQQGKQTMQQQSEIIHKLQDALDSKQPEVQARIQIAQMQEETKRQQIQAEIRIAELNAGVKASLGRLEQEVSAIQHSVEIDDTRQARLEAIANAQQPGAQPGPQQCDPSGQQPPDSFQQ